MELPLGYAPAAGNDSVTQCLFFKTLMRHHIGRDPDGAYLKTVNGNGRRGMAVEYEPEVEGAEAWAKRAREMSELVWEEVKHGKKPEVIIKARRSCESEENIDDGGVADHVALRNSTGDHGNRNGNGRHAGTGGRAGGRLS